MRFYIEITDSIVEALFWALIIEVAKIVLFR
jgi:hypothetical protein